MKQRLTLPWLARPGLAGGIDKDGSRAAELLGVGFGSVEFGSVTAQAIAGQNPGITALVAHLHPLLSTRPKRTAIGIGLGLPPDITAAGLSAQWQAGCTAAWLVADYISLNLSAKANRRFLEPAQRRQLIAALHAVAACHAQLTAASLEKRQHPVALAIKMPVAEAAALLDCLTECRFAQLTVVLPDQGDGLGELRRLAEIEPRPALVAVGGLRHAADVAAARRAGAAGIQVHRLFVEQGAACLAQLNQSLTVR